MRHLQRRDLNGTAVPPELVELFAHGWARTRGATAPVRDGAALRIETARPDETRRYVFARPPAGIAECGRAITMPSILIKAPADRDVVAAQLPSHWHVEQTGTMMTLDALPMRAEPIAPSELVPKAEWQDGVYFIQLLDRDGAEAARGRMTTIDRWALHDRIHVAEQYRRRGLGRAVMLALGIEARSMGATYGLLAATIAGRALYETLGWQARSPWTTAQLPA